MVGSSIIKPNKEKKKHKNKKKKHKKDSRERYKRYNQGITVRHMYSYIYIILGLIDPQQRPPNL